MSTPAAYARAGSRGTHSTRRDVARLRRLAALLIVPLLHACGTKDPAGPSDTPVSLTAAEGNGQFVLPGGVTELPLVVRALDPARNAAVRNVSVDFHVTAGNGATVLDATVLTDGSGYASTTVRAGSAAGEYTFEATTSKLIGDAARFTLHAVPAPVIASATPSPVTAGTTLTITGSNFSATASDNAVLFGGFRGAVESATATDLVVRVPRCVDTGSTQLIVTLGSVASAPANVQTLASPVAPIALSPGQAARVGMPADLACMRFAAVPSGARFLVVPQNAAQTYDVDMRYELTTRATGVAIVSTRASAAGGHVDRASTFEMSLRKREHAFGPMASTALPSETSAARTTTVIPAIGDRRDFNVLTKDNKTARVTAEVQHISQRAIMYVDLKAPSNGLAVADLASFGALFDDPIYSTDTSVFGSPSDIDANQHIIILFTPAVNALTAQDDNGFIAGYFYGCDLVSKTRCSATNQGEIFYSVVPDPAGQYGAARTKDVVLRTVPAVLAHEFQHMINFARKGERLDVLWLSEALAHAAEDVVGDVFAARGQTQTATDFHRPNFTRAQFYLQAPDEVAIVGEESPGTLEQRGGAWLLLKYAMMQYGGTTLLGTLTGSSATGATNLSGATGRAWNDLYSEFGVALWASNAPQLAGVAIDARYTFGSFDLRAAIGGLSGGFPLAPAVVPFQSFQLSGAYPAASNDYLMFESQSAQAGLNLAFTGLRGGAFATGSPQVTVLRVR
jgi:IPT/TIG domain